MPCSKATGSQSLQSNDLRPDIPNKYLKKKPYILNQIHPIGDICNKYHKWDIWGWGEILDYFTWKVWRNFRFVHIYRNRKNRKNWEQCVVFGEIFAVLQRQNLSWKLYLWKKLNIVHEDGHKTRFEYEVRIYCQSRTNLKVVKWG